VHEILPLAGALATGVVLGIMFFGGLWWTVARGVSSPRPALWFVGSKLVRTALALGGFYLVGGGRWERWLLCLLGFVLARLATSRLTRPPTQDRLVHAAGAGNAP
jgi:F1F0 ATPase subunit 2